MPPGFDPGGGLSPLKFKRTLNLKDANHWTTSFDVALVSNQFTFLEGRVEDIGIEPMTIALQRRRSPN